MAVYRNVQLSFWTDNKVEDDFTPEDKYFYIYLLTNPQTNICGCYEVSYSTITHQTGYSKDTIERLLDRFENIHKVIKFSKNTKEVLILNWYKYNWNKSEKTLVGVENVAKHIKTQEFRDYVLHIVDCIRKDISLDEIGCSLQAPISSINSTDEKKDVELQLRADFEIIYGFYPKKTGKTKGYGRYKLWVTTGKVVNGKRQKLTNEQIWNAIKKYREEMEQADKDLQYYKNFDTFMGDSLLDYVAG